MCLLLVAWQAHPRYRVVVAANRDEFHARPTAPLAPWRDRPRLLAGRDLRAGGTWIGLDADRRFGLVTNYRELAQPRHTAPSRGRLVPDFLDAPRTAPYYLRSLEADAQGYAGFNLLLGDGERLMYASNRAERFARELEPGLHGLSNHLLDTPWPKLQRVRAPVQAWLERAAAGAEADADPRAEAQWLMDVFADRQRTPAPHDPSSGLTSDWEQRLSAPFVLHDDYGTRCTTVLLIGHDGDTWIGERRFDPRGAAVGQNEWRLNAGEWPAAVAGSVPGNRSGGDDSE
jgi:uncharacterized protein with NRDE domain